MRYNVDPRQQAVRDRVKEFAEKEINPVFKDLDRKEEKFPVDYYRKLGKAGLIGFAMPKEYGGGGFSNIEYITLIEELAYWDAATALLAAVPELAVYPIIHFANDEQKKKYLPKCTTGESIPAFALTERMAGSDAANQQTIARIDGDHFVINGEKIFIMHGDACDVAVLFCRIGEEATERPKVSAIIIEANLPGFKGFTLKHKMGMRAATTGRIELKDYRIPIKNQLGEIGKGFRYAMATLDGARIGVAAQGVGLAQRALDESINYAKTRIAFGQPIGKLQAIQWMIADMATQVEAARALTYKAAVLQDKGEKFGVEAAQAKLFATEAASLCVDKAMQIHGGYGYIGEFSIIEKLYRDQRVTEIYEGTSEVQRLVIAGNYLR
ncbi:Acyl-CoA dehydrogenase, short-chain specific [Candidatus Zixiibacteriota bacterium]|nr:Acyl-CoA dehydrogenase, short-chain specific [candidate division Zixibacteria bacterium]